MFISENFLQKQRNRCRKLFLQTGNFWSKFEVYHDDACSEEFCFDVGVLSKTPPFYSLAPLHYMVMLRISYGEVVGFR